MYLDIGANIGKWSVANISSTNKIVAVEASPTTFGILQQNMQHYPQITCLNYAVCANNEQDIVFYEADFNTLSTINKDWLTLETSRF